MTGQINIFDWLGNSQPVTSKKDLIEQFIIRHPSYYERMQRSVESGDGLYSVFGIYGGSMRYKEFSFYGCDSKGVTFSKRGLESNVVATWKEVEDCFIDYMMEVMS